jgi:hypothetical protein
MSKRKQRPIDVKDVVWSHIGKDELDKAAELLWNTMESGEVLWEYGGIQSQGHYHIQDSATQDTAQRAVLAILGTTVPAMLRDQAKVIKANGGNTSDAYYLVGLAEELEEEHGN